MELTRRELLGIAIAAAVLYGIEGSSKASAAEPESGIRIVQEPLAAAALFSHKPSTAELLKLEEEERIRVLAVPEEQQYRSIMERLAVFSLNRNGRKNAEPIPTDSSSIPFAQSGLATALFGSLELLLTMPVRSETIAGFYNRFLTPEEREALASAGGASGGMVTAGTAPGKLNLEEAAACAAYVKVGILAYENGRFAPTDKVLVTRLTGGIPEELETNIESTFYMGGPRNEVLAKQALFRAFVGLRDDVRGVVGEWWFKSIEDGSDNEIIEDGSDDKIEGYYNLCDTLFSQMYGELSLEEKAAHAAAYAIADPALLIYLEGQRRWAEKRLPVQGEPAAEDSRVGQETGREIYAEAARLKEMLRKLNGELPETQRLPDALLEPAKVPLLYHEEGR